MASDSETGVDSETDEGVEEEVEKIPRLTQETLKEMTVKELREICHKWGVRSGGNKAKFGPASVGLCCCCAQEVFRSSGG